MGKKSKQREAEAAAEGKTQIAPVTTPDTDVLAAVAAEPQVMTLKSIAIPMGVGEEGVLVLPHDFGGREAAVARVSDRVVEVLVWV